MKGTSRFEIIIKNILGRKGEKGETGKGIFKFLGKHEHQKLPRVQLYFNGECKPGDFQKKKGGQNAVILGLILVKWGAVKGNHFHPKEQ